MKTAPFEWRAGSALKANISGMVWRILHPRKRILCTCSTSHQSQFPQRSRWQRCGSGPVHSTDCEGVAARHDPIPFRHLDRDCCGKSISQRNLREHGGAALTHLLGNCHTTLTLCCTQSLRPRHSARGNRRPTWARTASRIPSRTSVNSSSNSNRNSSSATRTSSRAGRTKKSDPWRSPYSMRPRFGGVSHVRPTTPASHAWRRPHRHPRTAWREPRCHVHSAAPSAPGTSAGWRRPR